MNEIILAFSFILSFLLALYGTPLAQKAAFRFGILDHPDGRLKRHADPVPYMGGVIVYFAFISPISLVFDFNERLLGILFASSILLLVGLLDDLKALTPAIKLLFQVVATYILLKSGILIDLVFLPKWLDVALSFFWILAVVNAFNIIDIMDGLAAAIVIASFGFMLSLLDAAIRQEMQQPQGIAVPPEIAWSVHGDQSVTRLRGLREYPRTAPENAGDAPLDVLVKPAAKVAVADSAEIARLDAERDVCG